MSKMYKYLEALYFNFLQFNQKDIHLASRLTKLFLMDL